MKYSSSKVITNIFINDKHPLKVNIPFPSMSKDVKRNKGKEH